MPEERAIITDVDHVRLRELVDSQRPAPDDGRRPDADPLRGRVRGARIVGQADVPRGLVTMNSLVGLRDLDLNERLTCSLCYPEEADLVKRKVPVTVPLGAEMLGRQVGDTFDCPAGSGVRRMRVERVYYQPESAGDFHL